jgi:hypothetical protein
MAQAKEKAAERARRYRERKRAAGLRLAWVPDHRSPAYEARLAQQATAIAGSAGEKEIMGWIEQVADQTGWVWEE